MLEAVEVTKMEPSKTTKPFQRSARFSGAGPDEVREINTIVRELGYLALTITLAGSYVSVTPRLSFDVRRYPPESQQ